MADSIEEPKTEAEYPTYAPDETEQKAIREVLDTFVRGQTVLSRNYNYFQGESLFEVIDDWTKRWNGYIPPLNPLLAQVQTQIFVNFTRNAIISYLAKAAMSPVKPHIVAVNKKTGLLDQKLSELYEDLNTFSLQAENGAKKFLGAAMECCVKGTVIVYEGYMKSYQKMKSPLQYDQTTGTVKWKEEDRLIFDDCFQEVVPLEDFMIMNPFQADIQKQPKILWRQLTSYAEAQEEFSGYDNWKFVRPGAATVVTAIQTFYRQQLGTSLLKDQVEILRYYCRYENRHVVMINNVIMYDGPIPFKDGKYPFAKGINEPFGNDFFWGNGHPNKYMGEQDLINTFINAMAEKTINSTVTTGLTSDLDDLIEDDIVETGKWRKVGDIDKWKYLESPPVNASEMNMFNQIMQLAREAGSTDAGSAATPRGGKLQTRQILLKQQELMSRLSFNMTFLEDLERDRTELRLSHILQFYSIPKIESITGKDGKDVEKLLYRDVHLTGTRLSDGRKGTKVIKIIDGGKRTEDEQMKVQDELSMIEAKGELTGTPTEALAISIDTFQDFNNQVQIVKNSSYEKNQTLDQASRVEFATWRMQVAPVVPIPNPQGLVEWVEESYDIDTDMFETASPNAVTPPVPATPAGGTPPPEGGGNNILKQVADTGKANTLPEMV